MKRIYLAGAGGMLGEAFHQQLSQNYELKCTDIDVNEPWLSYLDFRDHNAYRSDVIAFKPDLIAHIGAFTNLEYCELNEDEAVETNTTSVGCAVDIANELRIPLLYISTAGIFGGGKAFYDETDEPDPIGVYGRTKYMGEVLVQERAKEHLILRAGWMMGAGRAKDKKFVQKLISQIDAGKKQLFIVNDRLGTPTYTQDFANNAKLLFEKKQSGLFNMVCGGMTGRLEVAKELVSLLNLSEQVEVVEVPSSHFELEYFAERPACERLLNRRLDELGLNIMRDWKVALKDYVETYYSDLIQ